MKIFFPLLTSLFFATVCQSFDGTVLEPGQKPNDKRLGEAQTLHGYHPFRPVNSRTEWETRKQDISSRVQLSAGLLPLPDKTPLNAVVSEKVEKDGFAIQKVYFESFPGHFVTGTLYSPAGESLATGLKDGKRPVALCPHGHWTNGRFYHAGDDGARGAKNQIAIGAERFVNAAYNQIAARCVQLARMGCLVFNYDTLGNADSLQLVEHRRGPRKETNTAEPGQWGFVSPQSILRLQTNFGLQSWNSVRSVDFMLTLPEADPDRILVTGASGGATQTMVLAAIDDRVDASFPCVMASTAMQGGCTCENSYYLRIGQGNMDIAAAIAPKPLGLTAADDWTKELQTKGHPDLLGLYKMLKSQKAYDPHFDIHFKHNYNHVSRTHMYQFVNTHFKLGLEKPVLERDYDLLTPEVLTVWDKASKPANYQTGIDHERELNRIWAEDGQRKVETALETGNVSEFKKGWAMIIAQTLTDIESADFELLEKAKHTGFIAIGGLIRSASPGQELPALFYYPENWNGTVTIMPNENGKSGLFLGATESPTDSVKAEIDAGNAVVGIDLFQQGEFLGEGQIPKNAETTYSAKPNLAADSWQRSPVYFYGYNHSIFVNRVHDLLATIKMVQTSPNWDVTKIQLKASGPYAAIALAAHIFADGAVDNIAVDLADFTFESINDSFHEHFVPGAVRLGDVKMLQKLAD